MKVIFRVAAGKYYGATYKTRIRSIAVVDTTLASLIELGTDATPKPCHPLF